MKRFWVVLILIVLFIVSGFYTLRLFSHLNPELDGLLKDSNRLLKDNRVITERFPYSDYHFIFISSPSKTLTIDFTDRLIMEMKAHPSEQIHYLIHDLSEDIKFFKDNEVLFMNSSKLKLLRLKIDDLSKNKELFKLDDGSLVFRPSEVVLTKEQEMTRTSLVMRSLFSDIWALPFKRLAMLPEGRLLSHDGTLAGIHIVHSKPITDTDEAERFEKYISERINNVLNEVNSEHIEIKRVGLSQTIVKEFDTIWASLKNSLVSTILMVSLLLLLFYRNLKAVLALAINLVLATLITFMITFFAFKELNSNTLYLCILIIGNGINPGIIYLAYFVQSFRLGVSYEEALRKSIKVSIKPTLIACLSSIVAYSALVISDLKGYEHFGYIGGIGTLCSWFMSLTVLPFLLSLPLFRLSEDYLLNFKPPSIFSPRLLFTAIRKSIYFSSAIVIISVIGLLYGLVTRFDFLESNLKNIKSKDLQNYGLDHFEQDFNGLSLSKDMLPALLIYANNPRDLSFIHRDMVFDKKLDKLLNGFQVFSLNSIALNDQSKVIDEIQKLNNIPNLADYIDHYKISRMEEALLDTVIKSKTQKIINREELPENILHFFRGKEGDLGHVLYISFDLSKAESDLYDSGQAVTRIKDIVSKYEGAYLGGSLALISEISRYRYEEALPISITSFVLVLLVFFSFYFNKKNFYYPLTLSFIFTMLLFLGLMPLFNLKLNILSFIAIPLSFGIGVDYAVNLVNQIEGRFSWESFYEQLKEIFPHIFLASLTTILGYVGMIFNGGQLGLLNFGLLCFLGEVVTLYGALFILPHLLAYKKFRML